MIVGLTNCMISLLFATTFASASLDTEYTNSAYLDEAETFKLHWKIDDTEKQIWFGVQVKTLGWVGFGISAGTGNMVGSDVVIGWVKDNKGYLEDRYADAKALPPVDKKQDYKLLEAYEKNGETVLKFTRKYDTCDERDRKIEGGTLRLVYAYHKDDPSSDTNIPKHVVRGSRSLNLLNILTKKPSLPADVKHFDLRVNASLSNRDTTYYCKPFKMPEFASKKHIVKVSPIISPGNEGLVHHILVFECKDDLPLSNLTYEGICFTRNMPDSVAECSGKSMIVGWAIGGSAFYFPDHVGFALGGGVGPKFVLFEIHYDNPNRKSGLKDSSGFRFHYTSTLRQYDAGVLWAGWEVTDRMFIPPLQPAWTSVGYCPSQCTQIGLQNSTLPEGGIKVFASVLHSHLLGVAMWTKHVRNGTELPEIARDNHYDFNYQEYQFLKKEIHILPGDDIIQYCKYNSTGRKKLTIGGIKTRDEMCMSFIYYYPKVQLTKCLSLNVGVENFFLRHFVRNKKVVGFPPAKWTNELTVDLRKSYDDMKYVKARCSKQKSEDLLPIHNTFVRKAVITKPLPKDGRSCPEPEGAGTKVTGCLVLIMSACVLVSWIH